MTRVCCLIDNDCGLCNSLNIIAFFFLIHNSIKAKSLWLLLPPADCLLTLKRSYILVVASCALSSCEWHETLKMKLFNFNCTQLFLPSGILLLILYISFFHYSTFKQKCAKIVNAMVWAAHVLWKHAGWDYRHSV